MLSCSVILGEAMDLLNGSRLFYALLASGGAIAEKVAAPNASD